MTKAPSCGILCKVFCFTRHFHNERLWAMFEKNLELASLLDFYGEVLSERKQAVLSLYYNEDLSLAEIAEEIGISRQGVRDLIKKAEEELLFLEEKLGLKKKFKEALAQSDKIFELLKDEKASPELISQMRNLVDILKQ